MKKIILCGFLFSGIPGWSDAPATPPPTNSPAGNTAAAPQPQSEEKTRVIEIFTLMGTIDKSGDRSQAAWDAVETKIEAFQKEFGAQLSHSTTEPNYVLVLRKTQLGFATRFPDPAIYTALRQKLLADPMPEVAAIAQKEIDLEKKMEDLKKNPIDLKFTAVDGSAIDLAAMRGKVVLIDFWATWCPPCRAEVPHVVAAYKKYHDQGFEIVGISLDQDQKSLADFTKQNGMVWPQYFDGQGWDNKISKGFGIHGIPAMWLVDQKGMLVTTNGRDDLAGQVEKLLQAGK
jgi:thiol-disulfide isomerase/thioredoxin